MHEATRWIRDIDEEAPPAAGDVARAEADTSMPIIRVRYLCGLRLGRGRGDDELVGVDAEEADANARACASVPLVSVVKESSGINTPPWSPYAVYPVFGRSPRPSTSTISSPSAARTVVEAPPGEPRRSALALTTLWPSPCLVSPVGQPGGSAVVRHCIGNVDERLALLPDVQRVDHLRRGGVDHVDGVGSLVDDVDAAVVRARPSGLKTTFDGLGPVRIRPTMPP